MKTRVDRSRSSLAVKGGGVAFAAALGIMSLYNSRLALSYPHVFWTFLLLLFLTSVACGLYWLMNRENEEVISKDSTAANLAGRDNSGNQVIAKEANFYSASLPPHSPIPNQHHRPAQRNNQNRT